MSETGEGGPYSTPKERLFAGLGTDKTVEVVDPTTIKRKFIEQRANVVRLDGNTAQMSLTKGGLKQKTKALTAETASAKDFTRIIIYCPTCQGFGRQNRMWPFELKVLLDFPETYSNLVGGLAFEDDTIFLHCNYCDLRLLPSVDEVEKLDARMDDEYVIESLADMQARTHKPVLVGQTGRFNKALSQRDDTLQKRKRDAMEKMRKDYTANQESHPEL